MQTVQQIFNIQDTNLRKQIQESLEKIKPTESRTEQYCDYSLRFKDGKENLAVKQYNKGKLQVQGHAGPLYQQVLESIISCYNLRYPNGALNIDDYLSSSDSSPDAAKGFDIANADQEIPFPYIGTDESGKGDYFGPLVIAGVWLDEYTCQRLAALGVRDSKTLTDKKCQELAAKIRELCQGKYAEIEILPERYNSFYNQLKNEGQNLNHLLAWGHARAMENLLAENDCLAAVADKFGNEKYIQSKLMAKGRTLQLIQTPKAERYTAVAAASILARDRFLFRLWKLGQQLGVELPKGASTKVVNTARNIVSQAGPQALEKAAKMHFKTTSVVLSSNKKE